MAAVNSVPTRLPLPTFNPRTVLMYSAAVGGEGSVALQLREALPGDLDNDRLTITCNQPELLADLLHGGSDIESTCSPETSLSGFNAMAAAGLERRTTTIKKVRSKPTSPNRQGPQQCQVCNKIFGNASALAKHKLTHSDERKYGCTVCSKAFKRQDHLNGHMLTHRNKKPYECKADGCGKSYCDARSLRRHTENHHHHKLPNDGYKAGRSSKGPKEGISRKESPISPSQHSDQSSSGSEKSAITSGSESSPPGTPPAPRTPPARPPKVKVTTKAKTQQTAQQTFRSIYIGGPGNQYSSPSSIIRPSEVKPVECNLCHRKFKNIPALNGHMRLHGGYFKKESEAKKLDKKENTGPPLQTASVSVRALIEEKIISRRSASVNSSLTNKSGAKNEVSTSQSAFAAPAVPPTMCYSRNIGSPASPATSTSNVTTTFVSPRAPSIVTVTGNVNQKESTLIELLKRGNTKVVKRCASDPGQASPQPDYTFRPELFGVSFNSDDGYFSPALQDDAFHFTSASELDELALEDYATVAASIRDRSPVSFPLNRRLAAVLNSPLPESLADFGACHGGSPVPFGGSSPSLGFTDGSCMSPSAVFGGQTTPSPAMAYPTPPASLDAQSPAQVPRASSPLSAAFFTANLSSQEEVEEALEEVLPEECGSLDAFVIEPSPSRRIMLNSEDPLLSSSPRDFGNQRPMRQRAPSNGGHPMHYWQNPHSRLTNSLQVCIDGRDTLPAAFLSPSSIPPSPLRRKRRASPSGPCCSRMRRERTHYTPQPMLPPDRDGTGLFVEISSDLPDQTEPMQEESIPPQINIGSEHQADIPELNTDRSDLHRSTEQLLWDPGINDRLDDNEVRMFMELATCAAMPVGGHTREFALQTLGEVDGDVRAATLRLMLRPSEGEAQERWTAQEVDAFHAGIRHHEKDFYRVAQLIRTKTSKQCVHFYYFWKKVTKDYKSIFLGNWDTDNDANTQISAADSTQPSQPGPSSSTPSCEGDEYPCKICGKVFNKVKSRSAHMKSHRPLDVETKKQKHEKPCEKVVKSTH